ncbi:unnamed protein product [Phytophthora lilii]|uniref:Unnamed protein product n=1 Tax=Phytophthora lilii TaxID=2077276 RepID=A0A9W6X7H2_9STRA|nr:unnamed protein product [Phytophthora lilii]
MVARSPPRKATWTTRALRAQRQQRFPLHWQSSPALHQQQTHLAAQQRDNRLQHTALQIVLAKYSPKRNIVLAKAQTAKAQHVVAGARVARGAERRRADAGGAAPPAAGARTGRAGDAAGLGAAAAGAAAAQGGVLRRGVPRTGRGPAPVAAPLPVRVRAPQGPQGGAVAAVLGARVRVGCGAGRRGGVRGAVGAAGRAARRLARGCRAGRVLRAGGGAGDALLRGRGAALPVAQARGPLAGGAAGGRAGELGPAGRRAARPAAGRHGAARAGGRAAHGHVAVHRDPLGPHRRGGQPHGGSRIVSGNMSSAPSKLVAAVGAVAIRRSLMGEMDRFSTPFPFFRSSSRGSRRDPADAPRDKLAGTFGIRILAAAELGGGVFESWFVIVGAIGFFNASSGFNLGKYKQKCK